MAKNNYVDNEKFLEEIKKYIAQMAQWRIDIAEGKEVEEPRLNDYIGRNILLIANNLSRNHNFINYPFRSEMIADGVEDAVKAAKNFDEEKSKNPFSYFTTVIYWAMVRRIQREKKELYTKYKSYFNSVASGLAVSGDSSEIETFLSKGSGVSTEYMDEFIKSYESAAEKKKKEKEQREKEKLEAEKQ